MGPISHKVALCAMVIVVPEALFFNLLGRPGRSLKFWFYMLMGESVYR